MGRHPRARVSRPPEIQTEHLRPENQFFFFFCTYTAFTRSEKLPSSIDSKSLGTGYHAYRIRESSYPHTRSPLNLPDFHLVDNDDRFSRGRSGVHLDPCSGLSKQRKKSGSITRRYMMMSIYSHVIIIATYVSDRPKKTHTRARTRTG